MHRVLPKAFNDAVTSEQVLESVTLRVYAHMIQELTPAVTATFADAVEAALQGDSETSVSTFVSNAGSAGLRSVGKKFPTR